MRFPRPHSLFAQFVAIGLVMLLGLVGLISVNTTRVLQTITTQHTDMILRQTAQTLNLAISPHITTAEGLDTLSVYLKELVGEGESGLTYLILLDAKGKALIKTSAVPANLPEIEGNSGRVAVQGLVHVAQPILLGDDTVGVLRYGMSRALLLEANQLILRDSLVFLGVGLSLFLLVLTIFGLRTRKHLGDLARTSHALAVGNYLARASESGPEELANLGRNFNRMAKAVAKRTHALLDSEARYRDMVEATPDWVWEIDQQGVYTYASPKVRDLIGYTPEEMIGRTPFDFMVEEDRQRLSEAFSVIAASHRPFRNLVNTNLHKDGHLVVLETSGVPIFANDGAFLGYRGIDRDITMRKRVEDRLRVSEERLRFAIEGVGDGLWDWNIHTGELRLSKLYMAMLGYGEFEMPHRVETWSDSVHRDDWPRVKKNLDDYLAGRLQDYAIELRLRCKSGDYKWILCRGMLVARDESGRPLRMTGIHTDIHARKQMEIELVAAREAADAANRAKSSFLASMSHELRTPLNSIIGFSQMLQMQVPGPMTTQQQEVVSHILAGGRQLLALISDVLDLARIEAGRLDLSIEWVCILPVLEEAVTLMQPGCNTRQIEINLDSTTCGKRLSVLADRKSLRQVLANLLSNAVKYNHVGGRVALECGLSDEWLRVTVADTGPGIPLDRQHEIFRPFQRLGAERSSIEGTGIGLVISKRLIEAMGGRIGFESQPGAGSRFWFDLPVVSDLSNDHPGNEPALPKRVGILNPAVRGSVLYVEDNPASVRVMQNVFHMLPGVELLIAGDGESALALMTDSVPGLVLLDINLPGISGLSVLEAMRANARTVATPVIAVTAAAMPEDIRRGLAAGIRAYLTKPFDIADLLGQVRAVLGPEEPGIPECIPDEEQS